MKIIKISIVIVYLSLISLGQSFAQSGLLDVTDMSNINIDSYSDEEISSFYAKMTSLNISEDQAYVLVKERGLPDIQIAKLRNRLNLINSVKSNKQNEINIVKSSESNSSVVNKIEESTQDIEKDLSIFGSELFVKNSLVFEPNLRIATPASYILGPDDEIILIVYGLSEKKYNLQVSVEGEIYIPNVGPLYVNGLSIQEATKQIKIKLASTIYRAINSGQTKVQVSLGKIRSIRVTVIGQAYKSGTFTVSSLTTLFNLLYLCGGPNGMGSFRSIEVIRGNEVKRVADLYAFLVQGSQKDNVLLREGDVIRIPYYKNRVKLIGDVKREGKYEMIENETFSSLLQYSGGFNDFAYKAGVSVVRVTEKEKKIIDLEASEYLQFKTNSGDEYFVGRLQDKISNKISITGSVIRPGNYELTSGLTLNALIAKAGGIKDDAYIDRVSIFGYFKNRMPSVVSVSLDSVINNGVDFLLNKDDSVSVHSIFDFKDNLYINIEGNVRRPGLITWRENLTLQDVLLSSGGINDFGDSSTIEISRRIKNANYISLNHQETENFLVNLSKEKNLSKDFKLKPFDIVMVKNLPGITIQRSVVVTGEVIVSGKYNLQKSGEKISNIIKRTGGFRASADSSSVTIRRVRKLNQSIAEREKLFHKLFNFERDSLISSQALSDEVYKNYDFIRVNLGVAISDTSSAENLVMEDGDILTIEKNTNLVNVSGEVYYPTIIPFKLNKSAKYYIRKSGNFMPSASKYRVLVIYPNGQAKAIKSFLFFKKYPKVVVRSEVIVPPKSKSNKSKLGVGELALLVSALGIAANVIIAAVK